jgi:hypothetical protein
LSKGGEALVVSKPFKGSHDRINDLVVGFSQRQGGTESLGVPDGSIAANMAKQRQVNVWQTIPINWGVDVSARFVFQPAV